MDTDNYLQNAGNLKTLQTEIRYLLAKLGLILESTETAEKLPATPERIGAARVMYVTITRAQRSLTGRGELPPPKCTQTRKPTTSPTPECLCRRCVHQRRKRADANIMGRYQDIRPHATEILAGEK